MAPKTRRQSTKKIGHLVSSADANDEQLMTSRKRKLPSLRVQLRLLNVSDLKNVLRQNHQNPFGNKADLLSRIIYLAAHGAYPQCPKCAQGRLKQRLHPRKNQPKYYCPGFPVSFRAPAEYHHCDYVTDHCEKETFHFPATLNLVFEK